MSRASDEYLKIVRADDGVPGTASAAAILVLADAIYEFVEVIKKVNNDD